MHVRVVSWFEAEAQLMDVRHAVFVVEQRVPAELERDGLDPVCVHVLEIANDGRAIGAGRLTPDGRIGRMAVLRHARGRGVGGALLAALVAAARARGFGEVHLHAQTHALKFYERHGFSAEGAVFVEAGIEHVTMRMSL